MHIASSTQSVTQAPGLGLTHSRAHSGMPPIVMGTCPPRISALPPSRPLTQYFPAKQLPTALDFPSFVLQHEQRKHIHSWGQAVEQGWLFAGDVDKAWPRRTECPHVCANPSAEQDKARWGVKKGWCVQGCFSVTPLCCTHKSKNSQFKVGLPGFHESMCAKVEER